MFEANTPPVTNVEDLSSDQKIEAPAPSVSPRNAEGDEIEIIDAEKQAENLVEGFDMFIENMQDNDADPFVQEVQDFVDAYLKEGKLNNWLYITIETDLGSRAIGVSGNTTNFDEKLEETINDISSGSVNEDLSTKTFDDILDFSTQTIIGKADVKSVEFVLKLNGNIIAEKKIDGTPRVVQTPVAAETETAEGTLQVSIDSPQSQTIEIGSSFQVEGFDGVTFMATTNGLAVNIDGTTTMVRGNLKAMSQDVNDAYNALITAYEQSTTQDGYTLTPVNEHSRG